MADLPITAVATPRWRAIAALVGLLAAGGAVVALGVRLDTPALWIAGAILSALPLGLLAGAYDRWMRGRPGGWQLRDEFGTAVGLVLIAGSVGLLSTSSDRNSATLATAGVLVALLGAVPVAHAVKKDVSTQGARRRPALAQLVNAAVILLALLPGLAILGVPLWLVVVAVSVWFLSGLVERYGTRKRAVVAIGVGVGLSAALFATLGLPAFKRADDVVVLAVAGSLVLVILGLLDLGAVRERTSRGADPRVRRAHTTIYAVVAGVGTVLGVVGIAGATQGAALTVKVTVVLGLLLFGASFVTRGEGYAIAALIGAVVVWSVVGRVDTADRNPNPDATQYIVAIGDSYISGEGADEFLAGTNVKGGNQCRRSSSAYPYLVAVEAGMGLDFTACSGALARHVWATPQVDFGASGSPVGQRAQLDEFSARSGTPALVLVSIGGNDAGFSDLGKGCALPGSCNEMQGVFYDRLPAVGERVTEALVAIRTRFPDSPIVLMPYPVMVPKEGCNSTPLEAEEFPFLRDFVMSLDFTLYEAVKSANASMSGGDIDFFEPGVSAYRPSGVCTERESPLNVIKLSPTEGERLWDRVNPGNWTHNSFHPSAAGHRAVADRLVPWLAKKYEPFKHLGDGDVGDGDVGAAESDSEFVLPDVVPSCTDADCPPSVRQWVIRQVVDALRAILPAAVILVVAGAAAAATIGRLWQAPTALRRKLLDYLVR